MSEAAPLLTRMADVVLAKKDNMANSKKSTMRRFVLNRLEDETGNSGTGIVAEGVEFSNGQIAIHWISQLESVNIYANEKVLSELHGHDGKTIVEWMDDE